MINLELDKNLFVPKFYPLLDDWSTRWCFFMGSAGSAKSFFITLKMIVRACKEPVTMMVCRKYGSTIRNSCFSLFKQIIKQWLLTKYIKVNESDMRLTFPNGSVILFQGLDEETKLLSINDISVVFIEEAYELSRDIVELLNLRMRGRAKNLLIILAWNPISLNHWLYDFSVVHPPKSSMFIHSTYKDNPFLSLEYIDSLEELRITNPLKARIFCDGLWGIDADGLVLSNWEESDFDIMLLAKTLQHRCGCDIGWVDPTAIVSTLYDELNKVIYVCSEFYKSGLTLDDIYNAIISMHLNKCKILFDSAEPRTIDFFKRKYINAVPCIKGLNSVDARIAFLLNHKIVVHPSCANVLNELSNFSYVKNKQSGKFEESKYTHEFSHSIDAIGYAYSDLYARSKLKVPGIKL